MRVYTRSVFSIETGALLESESFEYAGPIAECKGATGEEKALQAKQAAFYDTMTESYKTQFAGQSAILKSLTDAWTPILQAGPGQKGFTAAQETALRTMAKEGTAAEYQHALKATKAGMAARGMGQEVIPSGADEQILGSIAAESAAKQAEQQLGITQANYERGYQLFTGATQALMGTAPIYSPTGFAGEATGAGKEAFSSAKTIQEQAAAGSPWGAIGGILGGAASAFTGGFGGALGTAVGGGGGGVGGAPGTAVGGGKK